jgi:hypothetical protein
MGAHTDVAAQPGDITVRVNGVIRGHFRPDCGSFTLGRHATGEGHVHVGPAHGVDPYVSRFHLKVKWRNGVWTVRNESERRPVEIKHGDETLRILPIREAPQHERSWPVPADGTAVEIHTRTDRYRIELRPVPHPRDPSEPTPEERFDRTYGPPTPDPVPAATAHDRRLLGAKFLSRRSPGQAIGNVLAAARLHEVKTKIKTKDRELLGRDIKGLDNAVSTWRAHLERCGTPDVKGRHHINDLGRWLWAQRVITDEDRLDLDPVGDDED